MNQIFPSARSPALRINSAFQGFLVYLRAYGRIMGSSDREVFPGEEFAGDFPMGDKVRG
jgi:hypothetical protein